MPALKSAKSLSPASIANAKPRAKDYELHDASGLRVRITPKGTRTFIWYVKDKHTGKTRKVTLGRFSLIRAAGCLTSGEARTRLEDLKEAHRQGVLADLLDAKRNADDLPAGHGGTLTVRALASDFLEHIGSRVKRPKQVEAIINKRVVPVIGDRTVASITPRDVRELVTAVVKDGAPSQAGKVFAKCKQMFRFAVGRADIDRNPCEPLDAAALGVVNNVCQRVLTPEEIAAFWPALERGMTVTVRDALRLLLLLGVRSGELLQATWDEVDFDAATWTIPVAHQKLSMRQEKNARPFIVPLPPTALGIFKELHALAQAMKSNAIMASFYNAGAGTTEKALNHAMRRLFEGKPPALKFAGERPTPHDLRRTLRFYLTNKCKVPLHVAEKCLNHSLGRIVQTYDPGDFFDERRAALEKWDAYLLRILSPTTSKVAFLADGVGGVA